MEQLFLTNAHIFSVPKSDDDSKSDSIQQVSALTFETSQTDFASSILTRCMVFFVEPFNPGRQENGQLWLKIVDLDVKQ